MGLACARVARAGCYSHSSRRAFKVPFTLDVVCHRFISFNTTPIEFFSGPGCEECVEGYYVPVLCWALFGVLAPQWLVALVLALPLAICLALSCGVPLAKKCCNKKSRNNP